MEFDTFYASVKNWNDAELGIARDVLHQECERRAQAKKFTFRPGQEVKFEGKRGVMYYGKVKKINAKYVQVLVHTPEWVGRRYSWWNVYPSNLEANN